MTSHDDRIDYSNHEIHVFDFACVLNSLVCAIRIN